MPCAFRVGCLVYLCVRCFVKEKGPLPSATPCPSPSLLPAHPPSPRASLGSKAPAPLFAHTLTDLACPPPPPPQQAGATGLSDDGYFKQELLQRLGPSRMQYVHLMDQLIYYEEMVVR